MQLATSKIYRQLEALMQNYRPVNRGGGDKSPQQSSHQGCSMMGKGSIILATELIFVLPLFHGAQSSIHDSLARYCAKNCVSR